MSANLKNSAVATGLEKSIFIPIPKKGNAKECSNYHTVELISHASKVMFKILQARLQRHFGSAAALHCFSSDLRTSRCSRGFKEESEIKLPTFTGSWRKEQNSRKTSVSPSWTLLKPLPLDHRRLRKILKDIGVPDHLTCLLRNCIWVTKQQLDPDMGKLTGSKLGKEYNKAVYCHPVCLSYMHHLIYLTSCKMPGWMNHKLE